jgi:hydroxymethylpyrimidine/phosphomethylpyrimidine kinase
MLPIALTIAGSDPSGGAGLQADLKTFHRFGVYGEAVVTLLTVQNTTRVSRVVVMDPVLVKEQIEAVLEDIPPGAAKTGALGSAKVVEAVAEAAAGFRFPLVVDPVMVSKHGLPLLPQAAMRAVRERLLPRAALITPNVPEAEALTGIEIRDLEAVRDAAGRIVEMGARAVLIKGGHLEGEATDVLFDGAEWREFPAPHRLHSCGTSCGDVRHRRAGACSLFVCDALHRQSQVRGGSIQAPPDRHLSACTRRGEQRPLLHQR